MKPTPATDCAERFPSSSGEHPRSRALGPKRHRVIVRVAIAVGVIVVLIIVARRFDLAPLFLRLLEAIAQLGPFGPVLFVAVYVLACVLMLPPTILSLGAGAIFGMVLGTAAVSIGATLGATGAFLVGRLLARRGMTRWITRHPKFQRIDEAVGREGWKIVLLTRLTPLFPFNLLNVAFGLTKVRLGAYVFASWIGLLPGIVLCVYVGHLAGSLAKLSAGTHGSVRSTGAWLGYAAILIVAMFGAILIGRWAARALAARDDSETAGPAAAPITGRVDRQSRPPEPPARRRLPRPDCPGREPDRESRP